MDFLVAPLNNFRPQTESSIESRNLRFIMSEFTQTFVRMFGNRRLPFSPAQSQYWLSTESVAVSEFGIQRGSPSNRVAVLTLKRPFSFNTVRFSKLTKQDRLSVDCTQTVDLPVRPNSSNLQFRLNQVDSLKQLEWRRFYCLISLCQ